MLIPFLATPDAAVIAGTFGICLIFFELNRPGRILPGACGLLLFLLATAVFLRVGVQRWAVCVLLGCGAFFLLNVWCSVPLSLLVCVTVLTIVDVHLLCSAATGQHVTMLVAVTCGGALGMLSALLARVAYRARRAKALSR